MAKEFDKANYQWKKSIDYRKNPEAYLVGKGEQGVLICEPYLSEILPYWRFKTPEIALESSQKIAELFYEYLQKNDFVGADLARKFLQMGFTRSRRYANYKGGHKYRNAEGDTFVKGSGDPQKIKSAEIFYEAWQKVEDNLDYKNMKQQWKQKEKEMAKSLKKGDSVEWNSLKGSVEGKIVKKIVKDEKVKVGQNKTREVKASKEDPKVLVKSAKTGAQAVHQPAAIKKKK